MNSLIFIPVAFIVLCVGVVLMSGWGAAGGILSLGILTSLAKGITPELLISFGFAMIAAVMLGAAIELCKKGGAGILAGAALGLLISLPMVGYASVGIVAILTPQ